jgi:hypothetical protein
MKPAMPPWVGHKVVHFTTGSILWGLDGYHSLSFWLADPLQGLFIYVYITKKVNTTCLMG